ncbi:MAG TPA: type II toxin-antitoxin system VapC family toxin [Pseudonocardia sp.]
MIVVLDASAVLALLLREPGAAEVEEVLVDSAMSAVNWSEAVQVLAGRGVPAPEALFVLGLRIEPFTLADAGTAALWTRGRALGLSLGDRACLALADRLDAEAWTADRIWAKEDLRVRVRVIR